MNSSVATSIAAGWFSDPWNRSAYRYWDGKEWTGLVTRQRLAPRVLNLSDNWWDSTIAAWGFGINGVDARSRDLSLSATRFQSQVP